MTTQTYWDKLMMRAAALLPDLSVEDHCQLWQVGNIYIKWPKLFSTCCGNLETDSPDLHELQ